MNTGFGWNVALRQTFRIAKYRGDEVFSRANDPGVKLTLWNPPGLSRGSLGLVLRSATSESSMPQACPVDGYVLCRKATTVMLHGARPWHPVDYGHVVFCSFQREPPWHQARASPRVFTWRHDVGFAWSLASRSPCCRKPTLTISSSCSRRSLSFENACRLIRSVLSCGSSWVANRVALQAPVKHRLNRSRQWPPAEW